MEGDEGTDNNGTTNWKSRIKKKKKRKNENKGRRQTMRRAYLRWPPGCIRQSNRRQCEGFDAIIGISPTGQPTDPPSSPAGLPLYHAKVVASAAVIQRHEIGKPAIFRTTALRDAPRPRDRTAPW